MKFIPKNGNEYMLDGDFGTYLHITNLKIVPFQVNIRYVGWKHGKCKVSINPSRVKRNSNKLLIKKHQTR